MYMKNGEIAFLAIAIMVVVSVLFTWITQWYVGAYFNYHLDFWQTFFGIWILKAITLTPK